jgi:uncharacterized protein with von Willebrand factor type A (vWA) domain
VARSPHSAPLERLVGFGRYVRRQGLMVGTERIMTFCRAAGALDPFDPTDLRLAARSTLVSRREDIAVLDVLFDRYFRSDGTDPEEQAVAEPNSGSPIGHTNRMLGEELGPANPAESRSRAGSDEIGEGQTALRVVASEVERLRTKDFADLTDEERRTVFALIRRLALSIPLRRSRRYRPSPAGRRFDLRRTLRQSLRTEGEPFRRAWKRRGARTRPLVVVLDVSGSMAPYGRPLVEFAHAAAKAGRRIEVFCFGTRLTRITRALAARDPGEALSRVGATVLDWEGGTRIGSSLKELLDRWSSRSALRGSVTVLCSDGLERGDPELLKKQMERLSRLVYRLIWVNPLKGSPRYEPLARGMAASLPFVDVFLPGHNLESLEALSEAVARG